NVRDTQGSTGQPRQDSAPDDEEFRRKMQAALSRASNGETGEQPNNTQNDAMPDPAYSTPEQQHQASANASPANRSGDIQGGFVSLSQAQEVHNYYIGLIPGADLTRIVGQSFSSPGGSRRGQHFQGMSAETFDAANLALNAA